MLRFSSRKLIVNLRLKILVAEVRALATGGIQVITAWVSYHFKDGDSHTMVGKYT